MFDRGAGDHRIEEQRSRCKIDNRRSGDAEWIDVAARETGGDRRANRALPNHVARASIERIYAICFSGHDDHCSTPGAVLDVQRLCVDAAGNRAVEVQIPPQIGRGRSRKSRIDVKPVPRYVVVLLRNVHLRLRWNDNRRSGDDPENGKEKFHISVNTDFPL